MDVMILCGGAGTRLRRVNGNKQKVLLPVGGKPFLDIVMDSLLSFGFQRFILCTGYRKDEVRSHFERQAYNVVFSEEEEPLGTGGAIKHALPHVTSSSFLVLNGDSFCRTNYHHLIEFHRKKGGIMTLVLAKPLSQNDYGIIDIDDEFKIKSFREKADACKTSFVNAGIYLMNSDVSQFMPHINKFSLEYDLMPRLISHNCYGFIVDGDLIDIGTPERYSVAHDILS
jgi:D-glycero-alpha-D-manno-heptose 1-phosphate guanylyltransferase